MPGSWLEGQTLPAQTDEPTADEREAWLQVRESRWWHLRPGEQGYDQPLHAYLGFTEQAWRMHRLLGGFR